MPAIFFVTQKVLLLLLEVADLRPQLVRLLGPITHSYRSSGGAGWLMARGGRHEVGNNRRARGIANCEEASALEPVGAAIVGAGACSTWLPA